MPSADRLTFGRVATTYVIPRGAPAPDDVALHEQLFASLAPALAGMLPQNDPTVWLIRRLDVDFPFALGPHNLAALGSAWAAEVTHSLVRALRDGENVARFPSRAAFLAQFVFDVAHGRETGCWYYDCFDSLRALPASAVIREAIVREPEHAFAVLVSLASAHRFEAVLGVMSESAAHAIYDVAFPDSAPTLAPSARMIEVLLSLGDGFVATPHHALRLAVAMCEHADAADVRAHVDRLMEFSSVLVSLDEPWRLVEALLDGDLAVAATMCPRSIETLQFFARLAVARPDVVTCAASTVMTPKVEEAVPSGFAGLAMLLPEIECESAELRVLIAVECAGTYEVVADPIVRLFRGETPHPPSAPSPLSQGEKAGINSRGVSSLGLLPSAEGRRCRRRMRGLSRKLARIAMTSFASNLLGFAGSSLPYLYANFLEGPGTIRETETEILVTLPPVPLEVVLHLAGMHDRRFTVPWIPDKPIVLSLGGRP